MKEKLKEFISIIDLLYNDYEMKEWQLRVETFLEEVFGGDEAQKFNYLTSVGKERWETLAVQRGYLEALETKVAMPSYWNRANIAAKTHSINLKNKRVFVVHGHDNEAKEAVSRFIEKLNLEAIVLHEQPNEGLTVIEKFENNAKVAFAVVLLTPDDTCTSVKEANKAKFRARQNVVLELGYFLGSLGRDRVCALYKGDTEIPSDYQGVLYIEMDTAGAWKNKLAQEFVRAHIDINLSGLL